MQTRQSIHSLAAEKICEAETQTDEHLRCISDALMVGTRVVLREPTLLHIALVRAMENSTTWRE
jgi:hypothetical protein